MAGLALVALALAVPFATPDRPSAFHVVGEWSVGRDVYALRIASGSGVDRPAYGSSAALTWGLAREPSTDPHRYNSRTVVALGRRGGLVGTWFRVYQGRVSAAPAAVNTPVAFTTATAHWLFVVAVGGGLVLLSLTTPPSWHSIAGVYRRAASLVVSIIRLLLRRPPGHGRPAGFEVIQRSGKPGS